jgi:hypothetical protein
MNDKHSPNFLVGLIIGSLLALLFWYWNKSTTAEDGALDMLDRYAASQRRVRELEAEVAALKAPAAPAPAEQPAPKRRGKSAKAD